MAQLDVPTLIVADAGAFRVWLAKNRDTSDGVWLVLAKKGTTEPTSLTYAQALEEALCQGWIDGQKRSRDATTFTQRFTPRRRASPWSKRNVGIAEELIAVGRMQPAGLAEIERAQADGRWAAAYSGQAEASVPADFAAALAANPAAEKMFAELNGANRFAIRYRIETAKRAETRARRIDQFVEMLARGETIHPQPRPKPE
ncbi:MAG TPA: YdeI/OmpD-associated family protein [Acidimicrobiia bacterium]|nr:YdeI/OmpD-associated family protein [Acidimicrobiia bacterium]